jgi:GMP synthase (glutamine-hydrolysing)
VLHWHGDTFDLPAGAVNLASTDLCDQQAFSCGFGILAVQFHLEVQQTGFERWLIGHTAEITAAGISVASLRDDTHRFAAAAAAAGQKIVGNWLAGLERKHP